MTEGNDVKHSWIGLNSCFSASPKYALTFLIVHVGDSISASRRVRFIANLGDRRGVDAIFNEGVYTWVLKIVTTCQTDSLTNLIKCVVVCRSYSYAFWSTSLWARGLTCTCIYFILIACRVIPMIALHGVKCKCTCIYMYVCVTYVRS